VEAGARNEDSPPEDREEDLSGGREESWDAQSTWTSLEEGRVPMSFSRRGVLRSSERYVANTPQLFWLIRRTRRLKDDQ